MRLTARFPPKGIAYSLVGGVPAESAEIGIH